jgi:signal transduction protein with GAF and PtsI domain
LAEALDADCCWVQLAKPGSGMVTLAASRGFTDEMHREMASLDMEHRFIHEIIGMGQKIIIADLNRDGKYDIPVFVKTGFAYLAAVPIMTYRVHGILGTAHLAGRKPEREYPELVAVIARLIGMSLSKAMLEERTSESSDLIQPAATDESTAGMVLRTEPTAAMAPPQHDPQPPGDGHFAEHACRMKTFRESHGV